MSYIEKTKKVLLTDSCNILFEHFSLHITYPHLCWQFAPPCPRQNIFFRRRLQPPSISSHFLESHTFLQKRLVSFLQTNHPIESVTTLRTKFGSPCNAYNAVTTAQLSQYTLIYIITLYDHTNSATHNHLNLMN